MNTADSKQEITILEKYLPKQASKDEVTEFLQDKDLTLGGRLIGLAKQHFNGNVDPQIVKEVIAELS
ncbi:MAG: GatB/YqeY domain-containing protein [Cytophagales bacterium]|nr:GatB/YqeY domain-containing protein [Cytophagales bacterium]